MTIAAGQPNAIELELLDKLEAWVLEHGLDSDAKARALIGYLEGVCKTDGEWNDERVVIFTEYRDTQRWLKDLSKRQPQSCRIPTLGETRRCCHFFARTTCRIPAVPLLEKSCNRRLPDLGQ